MATENICSILRDVFNTNNLLSLEANVYLWNHH